MPTSEREGHALVAASADLNPAAEALLFHAAHDAIAPHDGRRPVLARLGVGAPAQTGRVTQINASAGGVPKLPTGDGRIGLDGLEGDRQRNRRHHGRPFQALCLWSTEVIDELAGLGHPIAAGNAGENLTITGLDWTALRPGARLRIGSALAEVSFPATPCANQAQWFSDGDFKRIHEDVNPQWVRWYTWVREPGEVRPGDAVVVQP